jgi:hypothetical protein
MVYDVSYVEYYYYLNDTISTKDNVMPVATVLPQAIAKSNIFHFTNLPSTIKTFYKSAGILPYAKKNDVETVFLLGTKIYYINLTKTEKEGKIETRCYVGVNLVGK